MWASAAIQKRGKTTFGFTMPKPLAYLQLDASGDHALRMARAQWGEESISHLKYFADPRQDIKEANRAVFEQFVKDYEYCVENFRSVLVDTMTELLDVRKLAEFGRTAQIMQLSYGGMYADLRWLVKKGRAGNANVGFLHRMKDEYKDGDRTGGMVLDGWQKITYEAQVYVEHDRAEGVYTTTVKDCEQNGMLPGMTLSSLDGDNDFPHLAAAVFGTDAEEWAA